MPHKNGIILSILCLTLLISCAQKTSKVENNQVEKSSEIVFANVNQPHEYGGWYCPDNLTGFPAVDIKNWKNVPVVNGRLATKEETQNGTSLIFVDLETYPDAKPMDIEMPKLARFYNKSSKKEEIIIVIQSLKISTDSLVGFRYLNGGNGSARFNEVNFFAKEEIKNLTPSRFVTLNVPINASMEKVWEVITTTGHFNTLRPIFDKENRLSTDWIKPPKVNFNYPNAGIIVSEFAGNMFGNMYVQIDAELGKSQYVEKFLVDENQQTKNSELTIVCGPYAQDYEAQSKILTAWSEKVKELSEKL
ncbi:MAG: hypothetical protein ACJATA_001784 [Sphingobacteriales bacterium]|jgi:hypothetical protein